MSFRPSLEKLSNRTQEDAWSSSFRPSPNETLQEKMDRISKQQEAARISKEIDDTIEKSKKILEKRNRAVKVLLLGQAESGKSTMLRNFQLAFCPNYFQKEVSIWKTVIQLNIIGSVKKLLSIIEDELESQGNRSLASARSRSHLIPKPPPSESQSQGNEDPPLTSHHAALRLRLLPLLSIETNLNRQLLPDAGGAGRDSGEICVRAGGEWKSVLAKVSGVDGGDVLPSEQQQSGRRKPSVDASYPYHRSTRPHPSDPTPLLHVLTEDIHTLWTDPAVQALLKRRGVRMEQSAGFFLNDVSRIGKSDWTPAFEDIVRARVRTFGVEEHKFSTDSGTEWYIYDVGGSRSMRHQWVPYFEDVQAIIFLAPLVFNQVLDEDRMVNRLEDSVHLWKQVCSNRLLERANIILFLNKMDILEATLKAGVRVQTYVPSYGDLPNEVESVVKYFKDKFRGYHKRLSPKARTFFCHETSAIDIKATQAVLLGVREGILRRHLEEMKVI
ncbi:G-protein alpha subunit [Phlebopus sp. FC_14]|nr:G-protein alpha subunit [Phlebopus sp. FC_14]